MKDINGDVIDISDNTTLVEVELYDIKMKTRDQKLSYWNISKEQSFLFDIFIWTPQYYLLTLVSSEKKNETINQLLLLLLSITFLFWTV